MSYAISKIFITTVSSACLQNNQFVFAVNHWELKSQFLFSILEPYVTCSLSQVPLYTKGVAISILLVNFVSQKEVKLSLNLSGIYLHVTHQVVCIVNVKQHTHACLTARSSAHSVSDISDWRL